MLSMKNLVFLKVAGLFCLLFLFSCAGKKPDPCIQRLSNLDKNLLHRADSLILHRSELTLVPYRAALQQLHEEEKQIFAEVENCDFEKNLQAYNYWYRGRLKFPGKIEQELRRLERDSLRN